MTREWKPGDVAMLTMRDHEPRRAIYDSNGWNDEAGACWAVVGSHQVLNARPLVVIDPESAVDAERLVEAWLAHFYNPEDESTHLRKPEAMQAALREFANPTPTKPDEPMGLGAVVEDENGEKYVRHGSADLDESVTWCNSVGVGRSWSRINAVRILSEGVQP